MKIFFIGDIVGRTGRRAIKNFLSKFIENNDIQLVIANGENAAGGFGLTKKVADELFIYGISCLTMGNHTWDNRDIFNFIEDEKRLVRPLNYFPGSPGRGWTLIKKNGYNIAIINLIGQVFMGNYNSPFMVFNDTISEIRRIADIILVDFHAEATGEKLAFANYVDGKVAAVVGTHTHVQTADEKILAGGTAYISDLGLTGAINSILGMKKERVIKRFVKQLPNRLEVASGDCQMEGALISINEDTGLASKIKRIRIIN
jgi:2',3'-cyclic-nucleotide 2'-phosphodiesterase